MERSSPEPKLVQSQLSEVIVSDSRKRKTLTSLTPIPSLARPSSPQLSGKALEKTLSKITVKKEKLVPDMRSISTMKEMVSSRKSKHTDMTSELLPPPSVTPKPLTLHKKKLPGITPEGPEIIQHSDGSGKMKLKGALRGIPKRFDAAEESGTKPIGSSSPPAKQWEFKIPKQVGETSKLDTSLPSEGEDEAKSLRPPQGPPPSLKFQRHSFSLNAIGPSHASSKISPSPILTKKNKVHTVSRTKASPQPGQCDIIVSGHQRIGGLDDDASLATIHTLAVLEGAVARERRLKEELSQAQRQVVLGFRAVVKSFFAATADKVPVSAFPSVATTKPISVHRSPGGLSVPLLKCSVVVHTLVANIQSHVRQLQSRILVELLRKGNDMLTAKRTIDSRAALVPLDAEALAEAAASTPPLPAPLSHTEVLDSQTITQLKQLYFAYYDCESYVIDNEAHSPSSKRLASAGDRDIRNVIEEANVLVEGYGYEEDPRTLSDYETGPMHEGDGSMLFDEQREWRQIYSDDEDIADGRESVEDKVLSVYGEL